LNINRHELVNYRRIKIVAIHQIQILRLKCTKFDFGWGSTPADPHWKSFQPTSKGKQSRGREGGEKREWEWNGTEGTKKKGYRYIVLPYLIQAVAAYAGSGDFC